VAFAFERYAEREQKLIGLLKPLGVLKGTPLINRPRQRTTVLLNNTLKKKKCQWGAIP